MRQHLFFDVDELLEIEAREGPIRAGDAALRWYLDEDKSGMTKDVMLGKKNYPFYEAKQT
jgi:hypothetical protein